MEIWRDIPEYEGFYQASNHGRIKSTNRASIFYSKKWGRMVRKNISERILKQSVRPGRYAKASLWHDNKMKSLFVHQLIAKTFIPNPKKRKELNHINGDKTDNRIENLEWSTRSENMKHAYINGLLNIKFDENGLFA